MDITAGIVRIDSGNSFGTGFVVSEDGLIATCAHVVGNSKAEKVSVTFQYNHEQRDARVLLDWWRDPTVEDIAILRVDGAVPQGVCSLPLGSSADVSDHAISTFGFATIGDVTGGISCSGKVIGRQTQTNTGQSLIQLRSGEITSGHSGAPVWDELRQRVIGMVVEAATADRNNKLGDTAFATPIETLRKVCTVLQISDINPYLGLNSFTEHDSRLFFGRTQEVDSLVNRLRADPRFLVVQGPSGSGKSSLVQAGLIPRLRNVAIPGSDSWQIFITRPAADPLKDLATQGLANAPTNLAAAVRDWLGQHPQQSRIVVVIDQFEEMLVEWSEEQRQAFLQQLTALLDASLPATIIIVMYDDLATQFSQYTKLVEWQTQCGGAVDISSTLRKEDLLAIVQQPARIVGLRFEDDLVNQIVEDALEKTDSQDADDLGRAAVLPLLEFALTELTKNCLKNGDGILTIEAYRQLGGVTGSLSQWADTHYNSLDDHVKQLVRRIFTDLVNVGDETQELPDSCRRRFLDSLYRNEGEREEVIRLVQSLVNLRLLATSMDIQSKKVKVEIIHEALLHEWPLNGWIKQDRPFLLWHQELEKNVEAWLGDAMSVTQHGGSLLRGGQLSLAEGWMELRAADLSQSEQEFIKASRKLQDQRDSELKDLYEKAEAGRIEAEKQREEIERQRQEEVRLHQEADRQKQEAERLREEAEKQREEAQRLREEAELQSQIALSRQLTAQAELLLDQQGNLLQRAILLAVEGLRRFPSVEANTTLRRGLALLPRLVQRLPSLMEVSAVALSSDGRYLLRADTDKTVEIWDVMSNRQLFRFIHELALKQATFSADGRSLATVDSDNTVRVWETVNCQQLARLSNGSTVNSVTLNRDGRYLVTTGSDGNVWLWEVPTGRQLARLPHDGIVYSAAFSLDGRFLVTASMDSSARVWEVATGRLLTRLVHATGVRVALFSPDGSHVATAGDDYFVRLWTWGATGNLQPMLMFHEYPVNALAFSPDGGYLATASKDRAARIWEMTRGSQVARMTHKGSVSAVVFSADGRYLATTSEDRTVGVWEASTGYQLICLPHQDVNFKDKGYAQIPAFSPDGRYLITAGENGAGGVWEIVLDHLSHQRSVSALAFSRDERMLVTCSEDGTTRVWEVASGYRRLFLSHGSKAWSVAFTPHSRYLAIAYEDGAIELWEVASGRQVLRLAHKRAVNAIAYSPDGRYLASASGDETARVWDVTNGQLLTTLVHSDNVNAVAFSPDGRYVATASNDATGCLWEAFTGRQVACLRHKMIVNTVTFSPDGRSLATASWDHTAGIWEASTGRQRLLLPHQSRVWSVAFNSSGTCVATASKDSTAGIWDLASGKQLQSLPHDDSVSAVTFSPDGNYVATASDDQGARVWEVTSGRQIAYLAHEDSVRAIAFSPDGRYVASASTDGVAYLWLWRSEDLIAEAGLRLTRNLTMDEWRLYLRNEPYRKTCPNVAEEIQPITVTA